MRRVPVLIAIVGAVSLGLFGPGSAAAEAASGWTQGGVAVEHRVVTDDGVLTYGWRPFASAQERRMGAKGFVANAPATKISAAGTVTPMSASGCSEDVCMAIYGSGYYVNGWNTTAYWGGGYICTYSMWWYLYSSLIRQGLGACGRAGVFYSDWQPKKNFTFGQACNTWKTIPGKPCEWITS